jgi:surfeit locus 1 family protein
MRTKGLLGFTVFTIAGIAILLGLGFWQVKRLHWKEGLIANIEARTKAPPISLDEAIKLARQGRNLEYTRVRVEGRFYHAKEQYLYSISDGHQGWHVITPLETASGDMVLVDRGFVPDALKDPSARALGQVGDVVTVTGLVRGSETQGIFMPDNEPAANRWFWRDLQGMARKMFPSGTIEVAPFFIEAEKSNVPGGWPEGGQTNLNLPNNHLQYALTWFALAACLLALYLYYLFSQRQR